MSTEKDELDEKHRSIASDNAMLLAKVQELQNSIPELEVKCDTLSEKEEQLRELIERLETEKKLLLAKQDEIVQERDSLLKRCEEFTQTIYEYDVEKITMAGKIEEMQNKLEVICIIVGRTSCVSCAARDLSLTLSVKLYVCVVRFVCTISVSVHIQKKKPNEKSDMLK